MTNPETPAFLRLNVSGRQYAIPQLTISQKMDGTLFSSLHYNNNNNVLQTGMQYVDEGVIRLENNEYFVERAPSLFELILQYAYTGQLHCPQGVCMAMLMDEVRFWRLPEREPNGCCEYMSKLDFLDKLDENTVDDDDTAIPNNRRSLGHQVSEKVGNRRMAVMTNNRSGKKIQDTIWRLFSDTSYSRAAKVIHVITICFIFLSILNLVLSTVPSFQHCTGHEFLGVEPDEVLLIFDDNSTLIDNSTITDNSTLTNITYTHPTKSTNISKTISNANKTFPKANTTTPSPTKYSVTCNGGLVFDIVETICIVWFTFEWIIRFITCPQKSVFLKRPINIIDLMATLPYYMELIVNVCGVEDKNTGLLTFFRVLRATRVLRIFRLARYFSSLQVMGETLWNSRSELGLLVMFLAVSTIIFSTVLYYIERDVEDTKYSSIPASFYWCIVTLTTVGYGDVTPTTTIGKIVTGCACITGILITAFPVSILVEKFRSRYENKSLVKLTKIEAYLHPRSPRKVQHKITVVEKPNFAVSDRI